MTPLRQRMVQELQLQRKSEHTSKAYLLAVKQLATHYGKAPDDISPDEVRQFIHHLIVKRKLANASVNVKLSGIQFFYRRVLQRPKFVIDIDRKRSGKLPTPLSRSEIKRLFDATPNLKHRAMLMTAYGGGLRVSEVVRLRVEDIHSDRMLLHVRQGKGRKDRYTLLSQRLLQELRQYWRLMRPSPWLFPNRNNDPLSTSALQNVFSKAKKETALTRGKGIHCLRHSFATHLLEGGIDLTLIARLLGHKHISTTTRYLHVTNRHVQGIRSPLDLLGTPGSGPNDFGASDC